MVESGFGEEASWDEFYDATRLGWATELRGLKHYLEHHHGRDRIVGWAKKGYSTPRADAWKRLMSSEGLLAEGTLEGLKEGDRYSIRTAAGDKFSGVVGFFEVPASFVASVDGWNNALLRVKIEKLAGMNEVHVFLSAYDVPADDVEAFEKRWQRRLDQLFGE